MSSSSESEDETLKQVLQAVDTNFLNGSLYETKSSEQKTLPTTPNVPVILPSQRQLIHDQDTDIDFVPSETVQKIMSKKLSLLVQQQIEFTNTSDSFENSKKKHKSRVRLLNEFDCYVKPFEEFEYEDVGQIRKKPIIQRRIIDPEDKQSNLDSVAIDGECILSRKETEHWTERKKGKVYHYKQGKGIQKDQHLIEPPNEFTKTRQKNQWNESRIRKAKFVTK